MNLRGYDSDAINQRRTPKSGNGIDERCNLALLQRGRIAHDGRIGSYIFRNDRACADDRPFANRYTAEYGRPAANTGAAFDHRRHRFPIVLSLQLAFGVSRARDFVIDEGDAVADKDFVFDRHAFADKTVAGDFTVATDARVLLNLNERTNPGAVTDLTTVKVDEVMDHNVAAELDIGRDDAKLSGHELTALRLMAWQEKWFEEPRARHAITLNPRFDHVPALVPGSASGSSSA